MGWATTKDYRVTFSRANPTVDMSTIVVHHAVEKNALRRFPGLFDEYELHSIENLRGIPKTVNSDVHGPDSSPESRVTSTSGRTSSSV